MRLTRLSSILPPWANRALRPFAMPLIKRRASAFYSALIPRRSLVFDVGANVGDLTDVFLSIGSKVVCIEPNPGCAEGLRRKYRGRADVVVVGKGAGSGEGEMPFYISDESPSLSTFSEEWKKGRFSDTKWDRQIMVPLTTLDRLIGEHGVPHYCKIDVEGYELPVLEGLGRRLELLSFEFTREFIGNAERCASRLESLGFREFGYSLYSEYRIQGWAGRKELFGALSRLPDERLCGDIFAR